MTVERARVIKASALAQSSQSGPPTQSPRKSDLAHGVVLARRVPGVVVDARASAERIVADARACAAEMVAEASKNLAETAESAAREAREREIARVAAEVLVARSSEERRAERELARTIEVAVLLAERLVGEAIAVQPSRVNVLASEALRETRGARQVRVEACPDDVPALTSMLAALGEGVATVEASPDLPRGSLVVHTELGRVDARLAPQLSRLAEALRELLKASVGAGVTASSGA
jgi:flagellar biosynthesis/type III secretory pathway protein FliH